MAQLFGYVRVSTIDQNIDRQLDALKEYGVDESLIYQEKITGTKKDRPELIRMLKRDTKGRYPGDMRHDQDIQEYKRYA